MPAEWELKPADPVQSDYYDLPADRRTTWDPGIPGGIPNYTTIYTTIGAPYNDGETDATSVINSAIQNAGDAASEQSPQVVYLSAGTYLVTGSIVFNRDYVVLRGHSMTDTKIWGDLGGGTTLISALIWGDWPTPVSLSADANKGDTSVTVTNASTFSVGDIVKLDQLDDDSYVVIGDGTYSKRNSGGSGMAGPISSGGYRSVSQHNEITSKNGNVLGLKDPIYTTLETGNSAEIYNSSVTPYVVWSGIENLYLTGGTNHCIRMFRRAYCWVKDCESDGSTVTGNGESGYHIGVSSCYRCEVRGCYTHDATANESGGDAYGIAFTDGTSACLFEDNICRDHCKPITSHPSGGGNVIAYNYLDQAIIDSNSAWHETGGDCHLSFGHYDLWEGNWSPNLGAMVTHGNSGWQTYFRNYLRGRNSDDVATQFLYGGIVMPYMWCFNYIGNVIMEEHPTISGHEPIYEHHDDSTSTSSPAAYVIGGWSGDWDDGRAYSSILRHANYDYVTETIIYNGSDNQNLPNSLYLTSKPAFFGAYTWPWVTPAGTTKYYTLPAKARYDAM